ncbi:hypothetical protein EVAR_62385_1 [Eumeta japonica]|uniref:Uncharacterized protein n=1 Tax=Eumeta variegata TaxID=151549 RepID=A0A4C1Z2M6_EUMVA|nr:hypothetical protein EVAR_62385_1 [Eumeta japonica]
MGGGPSACVFAFVLYIIRSYAFLFLTLWTSDGSAYRPQKNYGSRLDVRLGKTLFISRLKKASASLTERSRIYDSEQEQHWHTPSIWDGVSSRE